MFTVKDLLEMDIMQTATLIAGEKGIDKEITFATIMETPEVAKFIKGGELMLSAGFAFKDDDKGYRQIIKSFVDNGVSAFGINVGRYLQAIPVGLIEECNKHALPLIILPKNMPYMDIMVPVWKRTLNRRIEESAAKKGFYNTLLDVILSEKGFVGICNTLSMLVENPVFLTDGSFNLLSGSVPSEELEREHGIQIRQVIVRIKNSWQKSRGTNQAELKHMNFTRGKDTLSIAAMPILVNGLLNGMLVIFELNHSIDAEDLIALEDATKIIALEMLKQRADAEIQSRIQTELLEDLLSGYYRDADTFYRHIKRMNETINVDRRPKFHVDKPMAISFLDLSGRTDQRADILNSPDDIKTSLCSLMNEYAVLHDYGVLTSTRSDCVICLFAVHENDIEKEFQDLKDFLIRKLGEKECCTIGLSNTFCDINHAKEAYNCAKVAASASAPMQNLQVIFYQKTGVYLLLNEIKELKAASAFVERYLKPLIDYDRDGGGELIKTMEQFFEQNGNMKKTAEALFVHKNSVIYRMNKVEELTGLDLGNGMDKFNLQLGLYLNKIIPK